MRTVLLFLFVITCLQGCNQHRVFHEYTDFNEPYWLVSEKPVFTFNIKDTTSQYNLYCNIRNTTQYPYSRIFVTYSLQDTSGNEFQKNMITNYLFEAKTGKPIGRSGLGDLYDHQLVVLKNYKFNRSGPFEMVFEQFMRTDTLQGILSVGLAIEKVEAP